MPQDLVGRSIAHYRITGRIGQGGMGEVYRARDTKLEREVAIKVVPAALAQDSERLQRFEREAHLLTSLNHSHIGRGKAVDRRADIWAFGVVLFEMLTGRYCFTGEEASDVLAAVLRQEIDWSALPPTTPPRLRRLLQRLIGRIESGRPRVSSRPQAWTGRNAGERFHGYVNGTLMA